MTTSRERFAAQDAENRRLEELMNRQRAISSQEMATIQAWATGQFSTKVHPHPYSDLSGTPDLSVYATTAALTSGLAGKAALNHTHTRAFNNNVARSLNANFTISATRDARVSYSINASWNVAALLSGTGTAFFEYSTDAGATWTTVNQVSKTLNLLTVAGADDMNLVAEAPAGALCRIRTTSTNMTIAYTRGQEVLQ